MTGALVMRPTNSPARVHLHRQTGTGRGPHPHMRDRDRGTGGSKVRARPVCHMPIPPCLSSFVFQLFGELGICGFAHFPRDLRNREASICV